MSLITPILNILRRWTASVGVGVSLLLCTPAAQALLTSCSAAVTPLAFGSYDPINGGAPAFSATLTVSCLAVTLPLGSVNYTVAIGPSATSGSMARQMAGPLGSRLNYNVYTDNSYGTVWGDGSAGTTRLLGGNMSVVLLLWTHKAHTIHGRLPAGQMVRSGFYSDSLLVTVDY